MVNYLHAMLLRQSTLNGSTLGVLIFMTAILVNRSIPAKDKKSEKTPINFRF